jgi:hypothetical protein
MRTLKKFRIWSLLFAGIALRVLPERVKGQHRAGEIAVWASSYPRVIER